MQKSLIDSNALNNLLNIASNLKDVIKLADSYKQHFQTVHLLLEKLNAHQIRLDFQNLNLWREQLNTAQIRQSLQKLRLLREQLKI